MRRIRAQHWRRRRWDVANDVTPSICFGVDRKLCDIYTLEFDDSKRYAGWTTDLVNRLSSHRRRWDDIEAVSFVECGPGEINSLERAMISDA